MDEFDGPWFKTDRVRIDPLMHHLSFYPYLNKMLSTEAILFLLGAFYVIVAMALVSADSFFKWHHRPVERFMHTADSLLTHWPIFLLAALIMGVVEIGIWAYEGLCWCGGVQRPREIRVG